MPAFDSEPAEQSAPAECKAPSARHCRRGQVWPLMAVSACGCRVEVHELHRQLARQLATGAVAGLPTGWSLKTIKEEQDLQQLEDVSSCSGSTPSSMLYSS